MDLYLMADWGTANLTKSATVDQRREEALRCFDAEPSWMVLRRITLVNLFNIDEFVLLGSSVRHLPGQSSCPRLTIAASFKRRSLPV